MFVGWGESIPRISMEINLSWVYVTSKRERWALTFSESGWTRYDIVFYPCFSNLCCGLTFVMRIRLVLDGISKARPTWMLLVEFNASSQCQPCSLGAVCSS